MNSVAIILARGGSKRIPGKNRKDFLGKPIIAYSIQAAIDSHLFDEIMVSTDSLEIAEIAKGYGASIPFFRDPEASNDHATTMDALLDVFSAYHAIGKSFEVACCLYPTAPFVTGEKLKQASLLMEKNKWDVVFPIMKFGYPIWRSLKQDSQGIKMFWKKYENTRSQDLPETFHDAGQFYFFKVQQLLQNKTLFGDNTGGLIIDEMEGQDIDTLIDWKLAEMKYSIMFNL